MNLKDFFYKDGVLMLRRVFLVTFIVEIVLYISISSLNFHNSVLLGSLTTERQSIYSMGLVGMIFEIFPHNLMVATIEFIPVIGWIFFALSTVTTSLVIAAEGYALYHSGILIFLSLALLPDTWIELPSYAIAFSTSVYLFYSLIKGRKFLAERARKILYMYLFIVLELAIAGTFESVEIVLSGPSNNNIVYPLMMWIPAVPAILLLIMLFRRINHDEYKPKDKDIDTFNFENV